MTIRRLRPDDAADFQALRLAALLDTPEAFASSHEEEQGLPLDEVARRFGRDAGPGVLGAWHEGALVGVVGLRRQPLRKLSHKAEIWGMYVAPAARGLGLARQLMEAVLALARETAGIAKVTLSVDAANVAAIALYESLGFVVFGRESDAMRIGTDVRNDLQMSLSLHPAGA
ncbi:MAG TPA: GNAT family N-acetyltransferase [Burkholderiaceae bacterium]